jgi:hypothetical protein
MLTFTTLDFESIEIPCGQNLNQSKHFPPLKFNRDCGDPPGLVLEKAG